MQIRIFLFVAFILAGFRLFSQDDRVWIEGQVLSADSLMPVRNVHIISRLTRSGTISDAQGRFVLRAKPVDTLYLSAVGYGRSIRHYRQWDHEVGQPWKVLLRRDTILMPEVVVKSFYDWPTFKHVFVHMTPIKPVDLSDINNELKDILLYMDPSPMTIKGPIQALYDLFNDMARLQRRLERNRRAYNEQLIREGKHNQLIPETPEHERRSP